MFWPASPPETASSSLAKRHREERSHTLAVQMMLSFWVPTVRTALDDAHCAPLLTNVVHLLGAPYLQSPAYVGRRGPQGALN